jgi:Mitochondrial carrier protein
MLKSLQGWSYLAIISLGKRCILHDYSLSKLHGVRCRYTRVLPRINISFAVSTERRYSFRGAVRFIMRTYRNDGFFSLWRGNSATLVRIIPYAAIQYAAHEQWKLALNSTNERLVEQPYFITWCVVTS